jgi:hypothetical protein
VDCPTSCPVAQPPPPPPADWVLFGFPAPIVIMIGFFVIGASLIIFMAFMHYTDEPKDYTAGGEIRNMRMMKVSSLSRACTI